MELHIPTRLRCRKKTAVDSAFPASKLSTCLVILQEVRITMFEILALPAHIHQLVPGLVSFTPQIKIGEDHLVLITLLV